MAFRDSLERAKKVCEAAGVKPTVADLLALTEELEKNPKINKALVEAKNHCKGMQASVADLLALAKKLV